MTGTTVVIGAGGFLGHRLCAVLADDKRIPAVTAISRTNPERPLYGARLQIADRRNPDVVMALLATNPAAWFDTAINDVEDAAALIEGASRAVAAGHTLPRFVITSTTGEFGPALSSRKTLTTDTPTVADDPHSAGKLRALEVLRNHGAFLSVTWAILPQMWGENDHHGKDAQGRTTRIIDAVASARPVYFSGTADNIIPDGYVDTIAQALAFLAGRDPPSGLNRVLVAGPVPLTPRGFVLETAGALSVSPEIIVVPPDRIDATVGFKYRPVFPEYDLNLDTSELYDTGFKPSADWAMGVHRTALAATARGNNN